MSDNTFRLNAYLERIGYNGSLTPSIETLRNLHRAQVMSIPFENLNLFLGQPILIDPASLMTKLIDERRGGYCYELNGLFFMALDHLGFKVTPLAARVSTGDGFFPPSHRMTLVEVEGTRWIADVGFGGNSPVEPLPLEVEREFPQYLDTYRLIADPELDYILQHQVEGQWRTLYAFSLKAFSPADYQKMNHFTSTSPESHFTQHTTLAIPTPEARIIIYNSELKIRRPDETISRSLENLQDHREALERYFGIVLSPEATLQSPHSSFQVLA